MGLGTRSYRNTWRAIAMPGNWEAVNTGLGTGSYRNTWGAVGIIYFEAGEPTRATIGIPG